MRASSAVMMHRIRSRLQTAARLWPRTAEG
uniref:Uncharacterized protein n=1 Tax=Arundo donax TaxID=35708 RepID=A0A0A9CY66_ARUDO